MSRRRNTVWFEDFRWRLRFEAGAPTLCRDLKVSKHGKGRSASITYTFEVDVPEYEARRVQIRFRNGFAPGFPHITVDGPEESPHRYRGIELCIWEPSDPPENTWLPP